MDRTELRGLAGSWLGEIDDAAFVLLLEDAKILDVARGGQVLDGPVRERCAVILEGTARTYLAGRDRRQLTVRYATSPALVSTSSAPGRPSAMPIEIQAVTDVTVLELDPRKVLSLTATNMSVAFAIGAETTRRLTDVYRAFSATFYGSLSERLATHLLYSAEFGPDGWVIPVTRQELATTLGTAREVVARLLSRMEADGLIETRRLGIAITDAAEIGRLAGDWWIASRGFAAMPSAAEEESIDNLAQPVLAVDGHGEIVYANRALGDIFGLEPRDINGRRIEELGSSEAATQLRELFDVSDSRNAASRLGFGSLSRCVDADGREFPAEITIATADTRDARLVFAMITDVSYRSKLRQLVAERGHATASPTSAAS